jgi:drug exporter, RND family
MVIFVLAAVWGAYAKQLVQVNYDMNDYLPEESSSTVSMDKMQEEFDGGIPNARVAVKDVSYAQALKYKEKLEKIKGVEEVTWLDDVNYLDMPIDMLSKDTRDLYYKDNTALYTVTIGEDSINSAVPEIRKVIGDDNAMTGSAVSTAEATSSTVSEIKKIAVIAVLIVLLVLCLTTSSWLEPFIVLLGIGVAVLINAGTNLMFGEVSFVTNAAGSILQLAVSLDYSVFLIHRFQECRMTCNSPKEAMNEALCKSASSILSSGLTTVIGFLALLFMRFGIGPDLGRALAKGIGISLLTVFLFMPGIILFCYRLMDKLSHRRLLPSFEKFGKLVSKITIPLAILFCVLMLPTFYASNNNSYYYGSSHIFGAGTRYGDDTKYIEATFGIKDTYVLMVKNNDMKKEKALVKELKKSDKILSITALSDMLGPMLPRDMIPNTIRKKLESENYSRMVLSVGVDYEGEETFALVEKIRNTAAKYYGNNYYLAGQGVGTYDLMDTITDDMVKVNLVAIAAVLIVLILTMRQIKTPIVLVLAIETAIWINLSIPYLQNTPLFYIAYLIISSVQLGATVDYAILFSDRYRECRREMDKKESIIATISQTSVSILTSGITMIAVGFLLGIISTHGLLSQLGYLLGKGTICSVLTVFFVLPGLLYLTDRKKTSF